jgi:predicted DCC family thiol-disulfide oxidoreductase YuxK
MAFTVYFDGDCPLCSKEILMLRDLDKQNRIRFVDIQKMDFSDGCSPKSYMELMSQIHGQMEDGTWVIGVEVFRQLYAAVGYNRSVALSRLPGVSWLLDRAYGVFARNRLSWTGREGCDGRCTMP